MAEICAALWTSMDADLEQRRNKMDQQESSQATALKELALGVQTAELFQNRAEKYFRQATQVDPDSVASHRG